MTAGCALGSYRGAPQDAAQAALQYCLSIRRVTVILGARRLKEARANAMASDGVLLTADEVAAWPYC
jgi:aryl-alcohol dehydrogenase-like predicted oxidoreductase